MEGRRSILFGVIVSIGAAYLVQQFHGIMDYVQALFSIFVAPLLGTILFGMFWKRATALAGFLGLPVGHRLFSNLVLGAQGVPPRAGQRGVFPRSKADGRECL